PELTDLQKAVGDRLIVMGVAGSESNEDGATLDERLPKLQKFVKEQGDKMGYRVAYDRDGAMYKAWMRPSGHDGIPTLFLVDGEGKLAWIGHPGQLTEAILEKVLPAEQPGDPRGVKKPGNKDSQKPLPGKK